MTARARWGEVVAAVLVLVWFFMLIDCGWVQ